MREMMFVVWKQTELPLQLAHRVFHLNATYRRYRWVRLRHSERMLCITANINMISVKHNNIYRIVVVWMHYYFLADNLLDNVHTRNVDMCRCIWSYRGMMMASVRNVSWKYTISIDERRENAFADNDQHTVFHCQLVLKTKSLWFFSS